MTNQAMCTNALLSTAEAAELLGMKAETLATWRTRGCGVGPGPPWYRVGGRLVRYRVDELMEWATRGLASGDGEGDER